MTRLTSLDRSVVGRVSIVTGAASGMGRATAHLFADEGAKVAVVDLGSDRVEAVVSEIERTHGSGRARGFALDVTDRGALASMVDSVLADWGRIDCLVNNAGVSMVSSLLQDDDSFGEAWRRTLDVNLSAYVHLARLVVPVMKESGFGRIVNVASTESIVATGGLAAYSASKAGVTGLTRSMAVELGRFGITVNCVCPGPINTGMTSGIPGEAKDVYAKRKVPLRRYGEPEEVAQMTFGLCLPAASFTNGATLVVDGGMTIRHT
ncbi:MAG: 3-oxoacyl-ACP reductase [Acidimicrobiales bacterium mtb01]|nr:SDR family oxidoreductase [Actinomycetota bacterium]TEX45264.1 MAG: 3-oxoacyl-ACP reductase [Acidimicrobiales bacterium mtb01]